MLLRQGGKVLAAGPGVLAALLLVFSIAGCGRVGPSRKEAIKALNQYGLILGHQPSEVRIDDLDCEQIRDNVFFCVVSAKVSGEVIRVSYKFTRANGTWAAELRR
jgi:hypothetical protein